jgi:NADH:ubiquinone oxidoreductase subunit 6 (subunit J)
MIVELIAVGLVVSACLAIYLDEAVYSISLFGLHVYFDGCLYALNGAVFVAVFQLAVSAGTLAVLF